VGLPVGVLGGPLGILIGGASGVLVGSLVDSDDASKTESVLTTFPGRSRSAAPDCWLMWPSRVRQWSTR
jgi:hypothetical protein